MNDTNDAMRLVALIDEVSAIGQIGQTYSTDKFDLERFERLRAISAEMLALATALPAAQLRSWMDLDSGYVTPKLDCRALIFRGETVLLVQEISDGLWTLPGGWVDINESPSEAVEKEVREESGLTVRAEKLVALIDKRRHDYPPQLPHSYKLFFRCTETGGELLQGTLETAASAFVPLDALPPLSLNRITPAQLTWLAQMAKDPDAPAHFD